MIVRFLKNSWFHILIWIMIFIYFFSAPSLFVSVFAKNGKPLHDKINIPAESDQITFMIDGVEPYVKDGENLNHLYGWAFIIPQGNASTDLFIRELALVSNERKYFFSVKSKYRNP